MPDSNNGKQANQDTEAFSLEPPVDHFKSKNKIRIVTLISFLISTLIGIAVVVIIENNRLQNRQKTVRDITVRISDNIHDHLNRSLSATYALAAVISQNKGQIENFEQLAAEMLPVYGSGINSLQLAPDGIISKIYPLPGNEKAIGLDLLKDPARNREALQAMKTRKLTLAGPFELIQGGWAMVGRLPVFITSEGNPERFWGFTAVLIHVPEMIKSASMQKIVDAGYNYELSRLHPESGKPDIFARSATTALKSPVRHNIEVPNNSWTLSVEPDGGWFSPLLIAGELALVLMISTFIALMLNTLYKQPVILKQLVDERTQQLSELNQQLMTKIGELEQSEKALRISEARLNESQKIARVGHYEYDITTGMWTNSEELNHIFGIDENYPKDVGGWLQLVRPDEREVMAAYLASQIIEKHLPFDKEYRILRVSDKSERWVHGLGGLEFDNNGQLVKMFGTIQDISDRKQAEDERLKLEQQMRHAQKLESLGVLAGGIAHDFNNIMTSILGHAELALMRMTPDSPTRSNLANIEQSAQRAAELSRQMLAYSGKGHFILQIVEIGELVSETTHMLEVSISKKVQLTLNLATELPGIKVDATQIRQVLMNLVINASEAIGDKSGEITITTGVSHCDQLQLTSDWLGEELQPGLYVYVEVTDNGCGMTRETISKIFDPFFTTKFTGRGLGMAAVMGIVRGHRGAIKIKSQPGIGTTFKVLLPAVGGETEKLNTAAEEEQLLHGQGTILLVDDEEVLLNLGQEMLTILGFGVLTANNGQQAIDIFRDRQHEIDAVLLDMTMPLMDGEETFLALQQLNPAVRVIISSGYNEQEVNKRFSGKGLAGFIQKPYKLVDFSKALKDALKLD